MDTEEGNNIVFFGFCLVNPRLRTVFIVGTQCNSEEYDEESVDVAYWRETEREEYDSIFAIRYSIIFDFRSNLYSKQNKKDEASAYGPFDLLTCNK